ncbi:MAG: hypothetical protein AAFX78_17125 [Cyanobacteria bacterium J06638_20]
MAEKLCRCISQSLDREKYVGAIAKTYQGSTASTFLQDTADAGKRLTIRYKTRRQISD